MIDASDRSNAIELNLEGFAQISTRSVEPTLRREAVSAGSDGTDDNDSQVGTSLRERAEEVNGAVGPIPVQVLASASIVMIDAIERSTHRTAVTAVENWKGSIYSGVVVGATYSRRRPPKNERELQDSQM